MRSTLFILNLLGNHPRSRQFFISLRTFKCIIITGISCPCSRSRIILSKAIIKGPKKKSKGKGGPAFRQSLGFPDARAKPLLCQHPDLLMRTGLSHRSGVPEPNLGNHSYICVSALSGSVQNPQCHWFNLNLILLNSYRYLRL